MMMFFDMRPRATGNDITAPMTMETPTSVSVT